MIQKVHSDDRVSDEIIKDLTIGKCFFCGEELQDDWLIEDIKGELEYSYDYIASCQICSELKKGRTIQQFKEFIRKLIVTSLGPILRKYVVTDDKLTKNIVFYGEKLKNSFSDDDKIENIKRQVAVYFGLHSSDLDIKTKKTEIRWPRQIAQSLARIITKKSLQHIGQKVGNRDHATVLHSIKVVSNEFETDYIKQKDILYFCEVFEIDPTNFSTS